MTPADPDFWILLGAICAPWAVIALFFAIAGLFRR